jgi:hypothetical protein
MITECFGMRRQYNGAVLRSIPLQDEREITMTKIALNDAQRDSHRATMQIHQETANRLISEGSWGSAKIALELALPHANAIGDKAVKSRIFSLLNTVRAKHRKQFDKPDYSQPIKTDEFISAP